MTEKMFTQSEINRITDEIYLQYLELFKTNNMDYKDLALVENVIIKIQIDVDEMVRKND